MNEDDLEMVELQVWTRAGFLVDELKSNNVTLVLYAGSMSPILKQRLFSDKVLVVENIGSDELEAICRLMHIIPWDCSDVLLPSCVSSAKLESTELGSQPAINLIPTFPVHSLVIAAPTQNLAKQYSDSLLGLLRKCKLLWDNCNGNVQQNERNHLSTILRDLSKKYDNQILNIIEESITHLGKDSSNDDEWKEPLGLMWELSFRALDCLYEISRIQGVFPTKKSVKCHSKLRNKSQWIGQSNHDSDSSSIEDSDDD